MANILFFIKFYFMFDKIFSAIFIYFFFSGIIFIENIMRICKAERCTNVRTEAIDNNLSFLAPIVILFDALICEPFINKAHKRIDAAQTNGSLIISQLFNSFGVAASAFRIHLTGVVVLVFLFFLVILSMGFTKSNDTQKTTGGVEESLAKS
ncbi:hypothetical protein HMPREF2944_00630 [Rothia sp. HMSC072E10]|nr:hypothetical protein HMPREF2944_00630 [Rothia sp. HMSC072E10]